MNIIQTIYIANTSTQMEDEKEKKDKCSNTFKSYKFNGSKAKINFKRIAHLKYILTKLK